MRTTAQPAPHRFDVLEHSVRAVRGATGLLPRLDDPGPFGEELAARPGGRGSAGGSTARAVLKLAALLHDVSKPETRRVVGRRVRFFEHDVIGAAARRHRRAAAPAGARRGAARAARAPSTCARCTSARPARAGRPAARATASTATSARTRATCCDAGRSAGAAAAVTGESPLGGVAARGARPRSAAAAGRREARRRPPPLLRGDDVMARFGLAPGPAVGDLLARAREAQALGLVRTREEALAYLDSPAAPPRVAALKPTNPLVEEGSIPMTAWRSARRRSRRAVLLPMAVVAAPVGKVVIAQGVDPTTLDMTNQPEHRRPTSAPTSSRRCSSATRASRSCRPSPPRCPSWWRPRPGRSSCARA